MTVRRSCTTLWCMAKSEVYSWRVSPDTKAALELEARRQGDTVAAMLDRITQEWLRARRRRTGADETAQARLHAVATRTFGTIAGGVPRRAERARVTIRRRLAARRGR